MKQGSKIQGCIFK